MTFVLRRPWVLAAVLGALVLFAVIAQPARHAEAHPLGNFTINRYTRIELYSDVTRLYYVLDMAEIPTVQETGGALTGVEADEHLADKTAELTSNLSLSFDGKTTDLTLVDSDIGFPEGQGGLSTTRISLVLETDAPSSEAALTYTDSNYSDRLGWKEIVVQPASGVTTLGDFATEDRSEALTSYPSDLLSSPPDVISASFTFDASSSEAAPAISTIAQPTTVSRPTSGFASLIDAEKLTLPVIILALLAAFGFGALHALEPGHGKTMVAAYFVGVKGTARHAMALGLIVAVTHTVGVLALGAVIIFGSQWILPERLYPWLSLASGVMILLLGVRLLATQGGSAWVSRIAHKILPHRHHHHEEHEHATAEATLPPWRSLVALGLADGLTPSPSAIVVLLAAVSLDRIGLGFALIVAFSAGLAMVLAGVSIVLMYARSAMEWFSRRFGSRAGGGVIATLASPEGVLLRVAPLIASVGLLGAGIYLTWRAVSNVAI